MDRVIWTKTKSRGDGSPKSESYPHAKKGMHTGWGGGGRGDKCIRVSLLGLKKEVK
jgi:hypothetical protein